MKPLTRSFLIIILTCSALHGTSQNQVIQGPPNVQVEEPVFGGGLMVVKTMNLTVNGMETQADINSIHQTISQNYPVSIRQIRSSVTSGQSSIEFVGTIETKSAIISSIQNLGYQVIEQ